jgi:predicted DNA-binding antitoxin AbrB/MazE fold protein
MSLLGTVVNGVIVPDKGVTLSEGARVRIEPEVTFEYPHPLAPYDREKELALLRERIAEMKEGVVSGIPLREAMAQIRAELNLPPADPE